MIDNADDDEVVTIPWLLSIGGKKRPTGAEFEIKMPPWKGESLFVQFDDLHVPNAATVFLEQAHTEDLPSETVLLGALPERLTRGHVRRLLIALGYQS